MQHNYAAQFALIGGIITTSKLMEYFNKQPRIGIISTASKDGKANSAVYGSPQMVDENTVVIALGRAAHLPT